MKLFLLCIGLSLSFIITLPARAQDTIKAPLPDTARSRNATPATGRVADTAVPKTQGTVQDTLPARSVDSTRRSKDARVPETDRPTDKDTLPAAAPGKYPAVHRQRPEEDSADTFTNSDTGKIVDIFEEMQKAREQQDKLIRREEAAGKNKQPDGQLDLKSNTDSSRSVNTDTPVDSAVNSALRARADSVSAVLKKDTIQSIFTLPETSAEALPGKDSLAGNADTATQPLQVMPEINRADDSDQVAERKDNFKAIPDSSAPAPENKTPDTARQSKPDSTVRERLENKQSAESISSDSTAQTQTQNRSSSDQDQQQGKQDVAAQASLQDTVKGQSQDSLTNAKRESASRGSDKILSDPTDTADPAKDSLTQPQNTPFTELFRPYRTFDKETQISSTTSLTILQQNVDYKTSADFTTRYQRTGQNDGQFHFDVSVVKLNTEVETMGVQLKYDSNQNSDSTSTFARPLFDIVGKNTFLEVDSTGKITSVDNSALGRQVNTVLSGLSLSGGDFEVGSNFGLLISKSGPAEIGQQWSDSVNHGGNTRVTTYTIQSIIDGNLLVMISGSVRQSGVIKSDGAIFKTHFAGTQKGKMYVDQQTLLVRSRDITLDMKGTVDYNGQALPASATSKIKEKVTAN